MRCPRCQRESTDGAAFCPACGAPLTLGAEPPAHPLDTPLPLDRRGPRAPGPAPKGPARPEPALREPAIRTPTLREPGRAPAPPAPTPAPRPAAPQAPAPAGEPSQWDLGSALRPDRPPVARAATPPPLPRAAPPPGPPSADRWVLGEPARAEDTGAWSAPAGAPAAGPGERTWTGTPVAAADTGRWTAPPPAGADTWPGAPAPAPGALAAREGDGLPDVDVDALEIHLRRPATWRRAGAWALDLLPFAALAAFAWKAIYDGMAAKVGELHGAWRYVELGLADLPTLTGPLLAAVALLFLVYATLSHALAGATLGKWLLRLRVVGPDGRRPTLARSAVRSALSVVSVAALGLGILLALFTRSGRALHDLVARTWVVEAP